jgi:hypothetical protein
MIAVYGSDVQSSAARLIDLSDHNLIRFKQRRRVTAAAIWDAASAAKQQPGYFNIASYCSSMQWRTLVEAGGYRSTGAEKNANTSDRDGILLVKEAAAAAATHSKFPSTQAT